MNNIDTSLIVDPSVQQPFLGPSLGFLQTTTSDMIFALAKTMIGNSYSSFTPYALVGIVGTGPIVGGYILYQDEVFQCPGYGSTFSLGDQFNIVSTSVSPDPTKFSDGTFKNVHNKRQIIVTDSLTPGNFNLTNIVFLAPQIITASITGSGYIGTPSVKYFLDPSKQIVYLNGAVQKTSPTTGDTVFTLPVGMRPSAVKFLPAVLTNNSGNNLACFIEIDTTGAVKVNFAPTVTGVTGFAFDGLYFYLGW